VNNSVPTVQLEIRAGVATVTLQRPEALNAISLELIRDLDLALDRILEARPRVRAVLLTGAGRAFCAGGDLAVHRDRPAGSSPYDLREVLERLLNPLLMRLLRLPAPLVVAVNGAAAGAGCPLALCGDFVIAAHSAYFQCGFARIGLIPDLGATWLLPRLIGRARAHAMMMLDQRVPASLAREWGMIHRCVDDGDLRATAESLAAELAKGPTQALVAMRQVVLDGLGASLSSALQQEARAQHTACMSGDFKEGIEAFFAKRSPAFPGTSD
jgi:2-(1,2-epoxy-1,2-dihydrophenyl)acetyl-CoA isomerase